MSKTIYLCGPINGCTDSECIDWREDAKSWGHETIDPMRRDYRGREDECSEEIVAGDKEDLENSNVLLVNYVKPSVGTSMEVFLAYEVLGLYVVVVDQSGKPISPWLKEHSDAIVASFDEARNLIEQYEV